MRSNAPITTTKYMNGIDFMQSLIKLHNKGGPYQKAAEQVKKIVGDIALGSLDPFKGSKMTNHGERRIKHCVKYDLTGFCRLVTVTDNNMCVLVYVGSHDDTDKWIEAHQGYALACDNRMHLMSVKTSTDVHDRITRITATSDLSMGRLLDRLDEDVVNNLLNGLPKKMIEYLREIDTSSTDDDIASLCEIVGDESKQLLIYDVLVHLLKGDLDGALKRIDLQDGLITPLSKLSPDQILEIRDGEHVRQIVIGSSEHEQYLDKYMKQKHYYDWFLFMHPEQENLVNADYDGSARVSGVSGSGKTCIIIRRAIRLAGLSSNSKILILTLNKSLAALIKDLVKYACPDDERAGRIEVKSFFELCQELLLKHEKENEKLYRQVTWKNDEHIDEVYREYYRCMYNNDEADVIRPIHRSLLAMDIDAESYVREEFDWIRSAVEPSKRDDYFSIERAGRKLPMISERRKLLLSALSGWESKMSSVGVIDYLGLATALHKHLDIIKPQYDTVLVDETQDFGTTELQIIRRLVEKGPNDIFLCGDLAQHILPKHCSFLESGIKVIGRSFSIRRNYRNSREILRAAYSVLMENLDETMFDKTDLDILDPQYANRSSPKPLVLKSDCLADEIMFARSYLEEVLDNNKSNGCIAIAGLSFLEIERFGRKYNIPVLDGSKGFKAESIFLSDLEQTKGYEFDTMIILNCALGSLPPAHMPKDEVFRVGCQLYVAMTRAKNSLILSYSGELSPWIQRIDQYVQLADWKELVEPRNNLRIGEPEQLSEVPYGESPDISMLTGRQYLYTKWALGLSAEAQEKIHTLVDGQGLKRAGMPMCWKNVGNLKNNVFNADLRVINHIRKLFGDNVLSEIKSNLANIL